MGKENGEWLLTDTSDENVLELVMLMAQPCEYIKSHWLIYFKSVNFMVCELQLNKQYLLQSPWGLETCWKISSDSIHNWMQKKTQHGTMEKIPSPKLPKVEFYVPIIE